MRLQGKTVAVTGASGFLGRYLVKALLQQGARVIAVVRSPEKVPALRTTAGVEIRKADLADPGALTQAFQGADALISNAALFSLKNSNWQDHLKTNIRGTENVLRSAKKAKVQRVVHVSSVAGYRKFRGHSIDENTPQHQYRENPPRWEVYAISKAVSEQKAWTLAKELDLRLTCIRPSLIYGAFDPNGTRIFKRLWGGKVFALVPRALTVPIVYAGDVAQAVVATLWTPESIGESFNTAGSSGSFGEFFRAWKAAGAPVAPIRLHLPVPYRTHFDNSKAKRLLGFRNRPFEEGIRETLELERARVL